MKLKLTILAGMSFLMSATSWAGANVEICGTVTANDFFPSGRGLEKVTVNGADSSRKIAFTLLKASDRNGSNLEEAAAKIAGLQVGSAACLNGEFDEGAYPVFLVYGS